MPFPADINLITVTGTYTGITGLPLSGQVNFTVTTPITDATDGLVLGVGTQSATLNSSGTFSITLPCTDNSGLTPANFTYLVTEVIPGLGRAYYVALPHTLGSTVELASLSPAGVVSGTAYLPLPTGTPTSGQVPVATGTGEFSAWGTIPVSAGGVPFSALPFVAITLNSQTFTPKLALYAGFNATLKWVYNGTVVATGVNPTITGAASGSWTVYLYAVDPNGLNALDQVQIFNIGYYSLDTGPWSPDSSNNYTAQPVTAIKYVNAMTKLQWFLAQKVTGLVGPLDFTGMSSLTVADIHCDQSAAYGALTGVNLSGCTSLQRLGAEACSLTTLDLNPVAGCLRDIRCAVQQGGALNFAPLAAPLIGLWHFCSRDNQQAGSLLPTYTPDRVDINGEPSRYLQQLQPADTWMPNIGQLWPWNSGQQGAVKSSSPFLNDVDVHGNWLVSADFSGTFPRGHNSNLGCSCKLYSNQLTSVNLTGSAGLINIDLHNNPLSQSQVDSVLTQVDAYGTSNGTLNLQNTAAPSGAGTTHKNNLTGRGWTVTVDASGAPGGGFGNKFTYGESVISRSAISTQPLQAKLSLAVNSGDLLVAAVEGTATPTITDSAGNTWTILGPYNTFTYLAYVLSAAASSSGLLVNICGGAMVSLAVSRFVPHGVVTFGGHAASTPGAGGYAQNTTYNLGNLGTVAADALAWGAFFDDDTRVQNYTAGFQTGGSGTPSFLGNAIQNSVACPNGSAIIVYVPGCANTNAALTWNGTGTGAAGLAVSGYFTST